jgi:hypothetical protein
MAYLLLSSISITECYIGGLLGPMLLIGVGTGLGTTAINIARSLELGEVKKAGWPQSGSKYV